MLDALPENISTYGGDIDSVMRMIYWICGLFFFAAEALLLYSIVKFRRREGRRAQWLPADTLRANAWVLAPVALVLVLDLYIEARSDVVWKRIKQEMPTPDVVVRVTGRQFMWLYTYAGEDKLLDTADDFTSVNDLHVPVDKVVQINFEAADVLHSWWVPQLRLKQDCVPGRSIPGWFEATKVGTYTVACAELCGVGHGVMKGELRVHTEADYQAWAAQHATQPGS